MVTPEKSSGVTRRDFVASSAVAAAAAALPTMLVRRVSADGDSGGKVRVGLIGCGGRGRGAADNILEADPGVELVVVADMFQDRIDDVVKLFTDPNREGGPHPRFKVPAESRFTGFDAYKKVLATDIDIVILATPPGFRPIHFAAAVEAGKNVFMEKPVAVDPVGVRKVIAAGELARQKKLGVVAGTQRRHDAGYIETIRRIHDGQIGKIVAARCYWNQGPIWTHARKEGQSDMEWQLRNWYYFDWLCGDHIVEQHIHQHDVMNWVLGATPVRAVAVGGRQKRVGEIHGNIYDHFAVDYEYPDGVHVMSMARQWEGTDGHVGEEVVGSNGESEVNTHRITGKNAWKFKGENPNSIVQEHRDLIQSIRKGEPLNDAKRVAESTLTSILGRQAAYTGKVITWDEILKSDLDLSPAKYEFGPLPVRPVPVPGKAS